LLHPEQEPAEQLPQASEETERYPPDSLFVRAEKEDINRETSSDLQEGQGAVAPILKTSSSN